MPERMRYRLALDLGSTSLGWAMIRLNATDQPCAIIKTGVRIFPDGRNPKDGSSLAVTRRDARAMRRRRDRLLKRKARMMRTLIAHGFFPQDQTQRKALETLNPYALRARGLDAALTPAEFARALFHINQRRGFKSNRRTDKADNDSGALKTAISKLRQNLLDTGCRSVGEWLHKRDVAGETVRARFRQEKVIKDDGKTRIDKSYDLYIDRAMIEAEFEALWAAQAGFNAALFNELARSELKDALLFQRPLKPVIPGRCTLLPEEERAPLALPSTQRFRIYQELANLRILGDGLKEEALTLAQRDTLAQALESGHKTFKTAIPALLKLGGAVQFNLADAKRTELKGNITCAILSKKDNFGAAWWGFDEAKQDAIVLQLLKEENESKLVRWLQDETGIDEARAETIAAVALPEGYGGLSAKALARILPALRSEVMTYDKAVLVAGFDHHSNIFASATGEILPELPYYGEALQRHVGFGSGKLSDSPEKRFGRIANPTVHIGLNQVRLVVNALIARYGHPSQVIVEVARDLKRNLEQKKEDALRQATNQRRNDRHRVQIAGILGISPERVRGVDMQKMVLWEELSFDPAMRCCPYSGVQISAAMLFSDQVEIEHILPFSKTLDDSLNNKTVSMRHANRYKGNDTPWDAFGKKPVQGFDYAAILQRAELMPRQKRSRFAEDGMERWDKDDKGFLARALNDTKYLSKVAREYLALICPQDTRVIPGQMTAMLRGKFGLNDVLGINGEKNRNDHRHHAVDACVIGVTDQGLLQRFATASADARGKQLGRLVENMDMPWGDDKDRKYFNSVQLAVDRIWVSHKPDHGHEGAMFDATIYSASGRSKSAAKDRNVIPFHARAGQPSAITRHGYKNDTQNPYKGLLSNSNYCIEIFRDENSRWQGDVLRTFDAYKIVSSFKNTAEGVKQLRDPRLSSGEKPLAMRLMINDYIRANIDGQELLLQVLKINSSGSITFIKPNETNISARYSAKLAAQKSKREGLAFDDAAFSDEFFQRALSADSLMTAKARRVTISPIGELRDPGFKP
jgi:CRISPR-associated endonuclease Csn1